MAQLTPEQSQLLMKTARRAGPKLAATVSRSPSIGNVEDAVGMAAEAWLTAMSSKPPFGTNRPFAEMNEDTLIEEVRKQKLLTVERREEAGQLLGKARADEEFQYTEEKADISGAAVEHVDKYIIHDEDVAILEFINELLNRPGSREERLRWEFQATLFRLHYGEKVYPGQPRLLTKNSVWRGALTGGRSKKIPLARKELEQYHQLGSRSSSCPTCKRIARFIHQVEQEQVVDTIDRLLLELRSGEWKLSS